MFGRLESAYHLEADTIYAHRKFSPLDNMGIK